MKALFTTLAFAMLLTPFAGAQAPAASTSAKATKPAAKRSTGTIVSASDTSLVITTASSKQETFVLNASTKKTGDLTPGTKVSVTYKLKGTDMVASAVGPAAAKKPAATSTSTGSGM